jgi:hypothetical protein
VKQPNKSVLEAAEAQAARAVVPEGTLERLRERVKRVRDLDLEISDLFATLKSKTNERTEILQKKLPDMMQEARVPSIGLAPEGNAPGVDAQLKPLYYANISADWEDERREAAFKLLTKLGLADIIKNLITVELGRGTAKQQKAVVAALRKLKVPFECRKGVPHNTLTAWIKERYTNGEPLSQDELTTLGATVGHIVVLKPRKT